MDSTWDATATYPGKIVDVEDRDNINKHHAIAIRPAK